MQERSQRGFPGIPVGEKMPAGGYRAKQLFAEATIFSAGEHLP